MHVNKMALRLWYKVTLLVVLALHGATADCDTEGQSCDQCYQTLANYLVNTSYNKYHLRRVFYPPERAAPVFVTVTYQYTDISTSNTSYTSIPNQTWYWGAGAFYFFQPLGVFQFTSLFFGNLELRSNELNITLPAECASAPEGFMTELTQTLKLYASWSNANPRIDNTYQAKAYNVNTLEDDLYNDPIFNNANQPVLLYVFQWLFPLLTMGILLVYGYCSYKDRRVQKYINNPNNWATITAHAIICFIFILYVFALDIAAVIFQTRNMTTTAYYNKYNFLHYYALSMFFYDFLAIIMLLMLVIVLLIAHHNRREKRVFLSLVAAGIFPGLLCLASHAQYIIIAWVLDLIHATSIGIYYAIFYVLHLVVLKQTYKGIDDSDNPPLRYKNNPPVNFNYKAMGVAFAVGCLTVSYQVLITVFVVYIPINYSVEDTPSRLSTIIHGVGALFLGLIVYKVIVDPRGTNGLLSTISGAIRKRMKAKFDAKQSSETEWARLDDEEKLTEVLYHVFNMQQLPQQPVKQLQQLVNLVEEQVQQTKKQVQLARQKAEQQPNQMQQVRQLVHQAEQQVQQVCERLLQLRLLQQQIQQVQGLQQELQQLQPPQQQVQRLQQQLQQQVEQMRQQVEQQLCQEVEQQMQQQVEQVQKTQQQVEQVMKRVYNR